jgi:hypothetical protein
LRWSLTIIIRIAASQGFAELLAGFRKSRT